MKRKIALAAWFVFLATLQAVNIYLGTPIANDILYRCFAFLLFSLCACQVAIEVCETQIKQKQKENSQ